MSIETERRNRIRASLFAYAYEFENESLVTDHEFDDLCKRIDPAVLTGHEVMDKFFKTEFDPCTGMWVRNHPELEGLKALYHRVRPHFVAKI